MGEPAPEPMSRDEYESWQLLQEVLEERNREWWDENEGDDTSENDDAP